VHPILGRLKNAHLLAATPKAGFLVRSDGTVMTLRDLPAPDTKRWVARRKAEVVEAVEGRLLTTEDACWRYTLTLEEFLSWRIAIERFGTAGLNAQRAQNDRRAYRSAIRLKREPRASSVNDRRIRKDGNKRGVLKFRTKAAFDQTITAIAENSAGVCWYADSAGLALILTAVGYVLTARPETYQPETLPERVLIAREDGSPMGEGHKLTKREREQAVRAILLSGLERRTKAN
jgi:hypothetical protein